MKTALRCLTSFGVLLAAGAAHADFPETFVIPVSSGDGGLNVCQAADGTPTGAVTPTLLGHTALRFGENADACRPLSEPALPFRVEACGPITAAHLSFELTRNSESINGAPPVFGGGFFNGDLWGIGTSPTQSLLRAFAAGDVDPGNVKLQDNLLTPLMALGVYQTSEAGDASLLSYLNTHVRQDGVAEYVQLRFTMDATRPADASVNFRYELAALEHPTAEEPRLTVTVLVHDQDNDGVSDCVDGCPADPDFTAPGSPCSNDDDGDGQFDYMDNCPQVFNPGQENSDFAEDGGDACDLDDDNDGVLDEGDAFPLNDAESSDTDDDGLGNQADDDDDNDGALDEDDNCPLVANADQADDDADGDGDACDADFDDAP